ncbi:MAG: VWA domain-containing protein, partial [Elusimicrobia bacterium]|nr:VWA domain-containing protein [Elusimicrobiota bacterium]
MEKKLLIFISGWLFFLNACEKKTTPILSEPTSSIYAISAVCTQVETKDFPYTRAFCSITEQNDQPLFGFEKGNFSLVENGNPTPVDEVKNVDNSTDPLSVVLVLDRSGSMEYSGATGSLDTAAINFVNQLGTKDEAEIINFDHKVVVTQGFTTNHGQLINGITNYADLGGKTALYDAIGQAVTDLSSRKGRKFILAMTDGWENSSTAYPDLPAISSYVNSKGLSVFIVG